MTSIQLRVPGRLEFREVAVRTIASACNVLTREGRNPADPTSFEVRSEFAIKVVSAFSEIFNNVVKHSYRDGAAEGVVDIAVEITKSVMRIHIQDHGLPFELTEVPTLPETPSESGRGLFIVRAFVDDLSYAPGPPNVWTLEIAHGESSAHATGP